MNFYVCICFLAVINEKLSAAESSTSTSTKSPEEGPAVTTESDVSQSAAQEVASSAESAQVKYQLKPFFSPRTTSRIITIRTSE